MPNVTTFDKNTLYKCVSFKLIFHLSIDFYITKFIVLSMSERSKVYVIQEIAGTKEGKPKINILGAAEYGNFKFLLPELSQIIFSPGPLIMKLRQGLREYTPQDYLLLTGDPAIIGVACSIVSDITNGKYKVLKWDKQERKYYPIEINLYEKGDIDG